MSLFVLVSLTAVTVVLLCRAEVRSNFETCHLSQKTNGLSQLIRVLTQSVGSKNCFSLTITLASLTSVTAKQMAPIFYYSRLGYGDLFLSSHPFHICCCLFLAATSWVATITLSNRQDNSSEE